MPVEGSWSSKNIVRSIHKGFLQVSRLGLPFARHIESEAGTEQHADQDMDLLGMSHKHWHHHSEAELLHGAVEGCQGREEKEYIPRKSGSESRMPKSEPRRFKFEHPA